jgi:hypothetical protein
MLDVDQGEVLLLVIASASTANREAVDALVEAQTAAADTEASAVKRIKRRFETGDPEGAIELATSIIEGTPDNGTPKPSETDGPSQITDGQSSQSPPRTASTTVDTPGFTLLSGIAGVVATVVGFLRHAGNSRSPSESSGGSGPDDGK